jgi:transcriptional regulator with XRE-family HTH domain
MDQPPFSSLEARRRRLGMSKRIVAQRAGVSEPTVARILSGREKNPSISNVDAIATALGASLSLRIPADDQAFRFQQAQQKARQLVGMVQGTMGLESQAVDPAAYDQMVAELAHKLVSGSSLRLWDP